MIKREEMLMTLDEIFEEIKQAESIVILTHESPDGDAIGSSLATNSTNASDSDNKTQTNIYENEA